jgi:hypothetical protein
MNYLELFDNTAKIISKHHLLPINLYILVIVNMACFC